MRRLDVWATYAIVVLLLAVVTFGEVSWTMNRFLCRLGLKTENQIWIPPNNNPTGGGLGGLLNRQGHFTTSGYEPNYMGFLVYAAIGALLVHRLSK